jgi:hypothetical protein
MDEATNKAAPFERTCRYGHGPLTVNPDEWVMRSLRPKPVVEHTPGGSLIMTRSETVGYALRLAVCQVCGYVELFDQEVLDGRG